MSKGFIIVGNVDYFIYDQKKDTPVYDVIGEDGESLQDSLVQFKDQRVRVRVELWDRE